MTKEKALEFVCTLGAKAGLNPEEGTISVKINRSRIGVTVADRTFVKKRITVLLRAIREDESAEETQKQGRTIDAHLEVEGVADTGRVSLGDKNVTFTMAFHAPTDYTSLKDMGGREATLFVNDVQKIPEAETEESVHHNGRGAAPKQNTSGKDDGGMKSLRVLEDYGISDRQVERLEKVLTGKRICDLEVRMKTKPTSWKQGIEGIGEATADRIEKAYEAFRKDYPMPAPDLFGEGVAEK